MKETMYYFAYENMAKKLFICKEEDKSQLQKEIQNHLNSKTYGEATIPILDINLERKLQGLKNLNGEHITGPLCYIRKNKVEMKEYMAIIYNQKMPYTKK